MLETCVHKNTSPISRQQKTFARLKICRLPSSRWLLPILGKLLAKPVSKQGLVMGQWDKYRVGAEEKIRIGEPLRPLVQQATTEVPQPVGNGHPRRIDIADYAQAVELHSAPTFDITRQVD